MPNAPDGSPLSLAELAELEATLLPALERHQLRLLAHGLRTLQTISGRRDGAVPNRDAIEAWALKQPACAGDASFAGALAEQLLLTADQLQRIREFHKKPTGAVGGEGALGREGPLELELAELCSWAQHQANQRLAIIPAAVTATSAPP
ncbi:hypothetical protein KBY49_11305 [Cyanobium sp. WAJ14-Wanaka]|nr:hypothetical protein [Cyanobium sp. WAJ14-Wanaka]